MGLYTNWREWTTVHLRSKPPSSTHPPSHKVEPLGGLVDEDIEEIDEEQPHNTPQRGPVALRKAVRKNEVYISHSAE